MRPARIRRVFQAALACACLVAVTSAAAAQQAPDAIGQADAMRMFNTHVERYARLRARLEDPLPAFDARRDPWSLMLTRRYLASAIRTARSSAHQADIFTPPVAQLFRGLIADAIYDVDIEGLVDEDLAVPDRVVDVVINEPVPAWARQDLPDALRGSLPALPDAIEYRVVDGTLILWDTHAEIVIDAPPGAFVVQ